MLIPPPYGIRRSRGVIDFIGISARRKFWCLTIKKSGDYYEERQQKGEPQKQLSKEFVRQWLISNNFQGLEGQTIPFMSDAYIDTVSERYIELFENITGETFEKADVSNIQDRIEANVLEYLQQR